MVNFTSDKFIELCTQKALEHFNIPNLRESQCVVLKNLYEHNNILATLPTGAGKTLLYTLPALVWDDLPVLVLSPLISLMRDQSRRMESAGIVSVLFTSDQSEEERKNVYEKIRTQKVKIIFASPERFVFPSFIRFLLKIGISMLVVDEAHCVVSWGTSFRPEYSQIGNIIDKIKPHKILSLTATASRSTRKMIIDKVFNKQQALEIIYPPIGTNIQVYVKRLFSEDDKWDELVNLIHGNNSQKTIVYFPRRELCDKSALALRKLKIDAVSYHAGLNKIDRKNVEHYVQQVQKKIVICATQAYGMGVDLANVKQVIVYGFPSGIEEYLQMIGRAGRGGEIAQTSLLWTGADPRKRMYQFDISYPTENDILDSIVDLIKFLPTKEGDKIVNNLDLIANIRIFDVEKRKRTFEGFLTFLRLIEAVKIIVPFEEYLFLSLADNINALMLIKELPLEKTRRSLFWESLCEQSFSNWKNVCGANQLFLVKTIFDATGLNKIQFLEILDYYVVKNKLGYKILSSENLNNKLIINKTIDEIKNSLKAYLLLRHEFKSSLLQLINLAEHTKCRLTNIKNFFGAKVSKFETKACNQCDLCLNKQKKSISPYL